MWHLVLRVEGSSRRVAVRALLPDQHDELVVARRRTTFGAARVVEYFVVVSARGEAELPISYEIS